MCVNGFQLYFGSLEFLLLYFIGIFLNDEEYK